MSRDTTGEPGTLVHICEGKPSLPWPPGCSCPAQLLVIQVGLDVGEEVGVPMGDAVPVHVLQPETLARTQQARAHRPLPPSPVGLQSQAWPWGTVLTSPAVGASASSDRSVESIRVSAVTTCKRGPAGCGQCLGGRAPVSSRHLSPGASQHLRHEPAEHQLAGAQGSFRPVPGFWEVPGGPGRGHGQAGQTRVPGSPPRCP